MIHTALVRLHLSVLVVIIIKDIKYIILVSALNI